MAASATGTGAAPSRPSSGPARALVLVSHPQWDASVVQRAMLEGIEGLDRVSVRRLDALYPDFQIDVAAEQAAVREHALLIFQHPLYWYSSPPLLKQWIDLVLLKDFAFGRKDPETRGKTLWSVVSAGGPEAAYQEGGFNAYPIAQFLIPFERTAAFCKMTYAPPLILHNTYRLAPDAIDAHAKLYRGELMRRLSEIDTGADDAARG